MATTAVTKKESISRDSWTAEDRKVVADHQWWSREELSSTTETIYPEGLVEMLDNAGVFGAEWPHRTSDAKTIGPLHACWPRTSNSA
jgi:hypothetical protein